MIRPACLLLAAAVSAAAADPSLLQLVSPDARALSGISVRQAKASPFGQFLMSQAAIAGKEFESFVAASGFDPRHNLDEILMATTGGVDPTKTRNLIVARGSFTPDRIIALAKTAGAQVASHQDVDIITPGSASIGPAGTTFCFAFLDPTLAVAGDPDSVRGAIERRQSGAGPKPDLAAKANEVSAAYDLWFVSMVPMDGFLGGAPGGDAPAESLQKEVLRSIEQSSGGIKLADAVSLSAEIIARTAEDASNLVSVAKFVAGMAAFQPGKKGGPGPLEALLSSLDLKAEGKTVRIALSIPEQELEKLIRSVREKALAAPVTALPK